MLRKDSKFFCHKLKSNFEFTNENISNKIYYNERNEITEGAYYNVFFIKDNRIYTPPLNNILNGIVRQNIINNFDITEKKIYKSDLITFESIFITNSLQEIRSIEKINNLNFKKYKKEKKLLSFLHTTNDFILI